MFSNKTAAFLSHVGREVERAEKKHGASFASAHEGHSVIREELEELWEHVKGDTAYSAEAYKEATQVAAMAVKFMRMIEERVELSRIERGAAL